MRLLKDKTYNFEPFHSSLKFINRNSEEFVDRKPGPAEFSSAKLLEKYSYMMQNIISFEKQTSDNDNRESLQKALKMSLKRIIPVKEAGLFYFDEYFSSLIPFDNNFSEEFSVNVNNIHKEGVIDWIFDSAKPTMIPEVNNYTVDGPRLNFIFYPVYEKDKRKGLLAILTTARKRDFGYFEEQSIQVILNLSIAKIEKLNLKDKLNATYNELQSYQAKLRNDFRLSAIGELTEGIVEDIKSPLQVILSYVDLLSSDEKDKGPASIVKEQVKKINFLINRLIKFAGVNEDKLQINPCDINTIINDFYNLVNTSLENANIECILDFEKNIPPILSHRSYLYQLLSTVVNMIKYSSPSGGGLILQTRYVADHICVKVFNTAYLSPYHSQHDAADKKSFDLNMKIVENLMRMHEGELSIESFQENSSVILLKFPLRRKIRK